jgi:hypothetical protein
MCDSLKQGIISLSTGKFINPLELLSLSVPRQVAGRALSKLNSITIKIIYFN